MSENIFCNSFAEVKQIVDHFVEEEYVNSNLNVDRIKHNGHVWTREATFSKSIAGWDRFVLFIESLFAKICTSLRLSSLSGADRIKLDRKWNLAWEGTSHFVVYIELMKLINRSVYEYIAPNLPIALRNVNTNAKRAPQVIAVQDGFAVRLPKLMMAQIPGFKNKLALASVPYIERDISFGPVHNRFNKEFFISNENMGRFLAELPNLNLGSLSPEIEQELFSSLGARTYTRHAADNYGRPLAKTAIALTLTRLNPNFELCDRLRNVEMRILPDQFAGLPLPFVDVNSFGIMTIKIPENETFMKERIEAVFGLIPKAIEETICGQNYATQFDIARDEIETFMQNLGLGVVPPEMHADYTDGHLTYFQSLINTGDVHHYDPVHRENPMLSLSESLAAVIPNEGQLLELDDHTFVLQPIKPYVCIHPKGWLAIRLPALPEGCGNTYPEHLQAYLKCQQFFTINFHDHGQTYNRELRIDKVDIPDFLKLMRLQQDAEGNDFLEKLAPFSVGQNYAPTFVASSVRNQQNAPVDIFKTIGASLCSHLVGPCSELPAVAIAWDGITILIPEGLQQKVLILGGQDVSFGKYLSSIYGIEGRPAGSCYQLKVPAACIQSFLEGDLSLRQLPENMRLNGRNTFYQAAVEQYGSRFSVESHRAGDIKGWSLRNPTPPLPSSIPSFYDSQIVSKARVILEGHPRCEQYCQVIEETLSRKGLIRASQTLVDYLSLIIEPTPEQVRAGVTIDRQRAALATIGATATDCMPGRFTKVQLEYQCMLVPDARDQLKAVMLKEVEEYKLGLLAVIMRSPSGDGIMDVHYVASAQVAWGAELGLDVEAGRRDQYAYATNVRDEQKSEFMRLCQANMLQTLFEQFSAARDFVEPEKLAYQELIIERVNAELNSQGYTKTEIDGIYDESTLEFSGGLRDRVLPRDPEGNIRLTKEALELVLANIGVLHS